MSGKTDRSKGARGKAPQIHFFPLTKLRLKVWELKDHRRGGFPLPFACCFLLLIKRVLFPFPALSLLAFFFFPEVFDLSLYVRVSVFLLLTFLMRFLAFYFFPLIKLQILHFSGHFYEKKKKWNAEKQVQRIHRRKIDFLLLCKCVPEIRSDFLFTFSSSLFCFSFDASYQNFQPNSSRNVDRRSAPVQTSGIALFRSWGSRGLLIDQM
jgi:hypothetical protein